MPFLRPRDLSHQKARSNDQAKRSEHPANHPAIPAVRRGSRLKALPATVRPAEAAKAATAAQKTAFSAARNPVTSSPRGLPYRRKENTRTILSHFVRAEREG